VVAKFTIKQPDDSVLIKNIAFEYERKDSHTKEQLIQYFTNWIEKSFSFIPI